MEPNPNAKLMTWPVKTEDVDADARTMVVVISTDAKDRDSEVVLPMGIKTGNFQKNPVVLWAHDYRSLPIARCLWTKATKDGVKAKVQFADYDFAKLCFDLYRQGYLSAWSIGFLPVDGKSRQPTEADLKKRPDWAGVRRIYEETELLEFSAVPVPSNPEALRLALEAAVTKGIKLPAELSVEPKATETSKDNSANQDTGPVETVKILDTPADMRQLEATVLRPLPPRQAEIRLLGTSEELDRVVKARLRGRVTLD